MTDFVCTARYCGAVIGVPCSLDAPSPTGGRRQRGLDQFCPRCGATPGRRCVDLAMTAPSFHTKVPHRERWTLRGSRWIAQEWGRGAVPPPWPAPDADDDGWETIIGDWPWDGRRATAEDHQ